MKASEAYALAYSQDKPLNLEQCLEVIRVACLGKGYHCRISNLSDSTLLGLLQLGYTITVQGDSNLITWKG